MTEYWFRSSLGNSIDMSGLEIPDLHCSKDEYTKF